jgi:hypothetical protein
MEGRAEQCDGFPSSDAIFIAGSSAAVAGMASPEAFTLGRIQGVLPEQVADLIGGVSHPTGLLAQPVLHSCWQRISDEVQPGKHAAQSPGHLCA